MMTPSQTDLTPTKLALRRTVRTQRQARPASDREQIERALAANALELPPLRRAACVAIYASLPDEPGTTLLRAALRERGTRVLLPVISDDVTLAWADDDGTVQPAGRLGVPEPLGRRASPQELGAAEVIIVPALAVDTRGTRLGRGRGYYDRALSQARDDALILAVVHDDEVLDSADTPIPREEHDIVVHGVLTPTRWMFFAPVS
jgi:5-formyltetrahydrofolate cyclo-ligase